MPRAKRKASAVESNKGGGNEVVASGSELRRIERIRAQVMASIIQEYFPVVDGGHLVGGRASSDHPWLLVRDAALVKKSLTELALADLSQSQGASCGLDQDVKGLPVHVVVLERWFESLTTLLKFLLPVTVEGSSVHMSLVKTLLELTALSLGQMSPGPLASVPNSDVAGVLASHLPALSGAVAPAFKSASGRESREGSELVLPLAALSLSLHRAASAASAQVKSMWTSSSCLSSLVAPLLSAIGNAPGDAGLVSITAATVMVLRSGMRPKLPVLKELWLNGVAFVLENPELSTVKRLESAYASFLCAIVAIAPADDGQWETSVGDCLAALKYLTLAVSHPETPKQDLDALFGQDGFGDLSRALRAGLEGLVGATVSGVRHAGVVVEAIALTLSSLNALLSSQVTPALVALPVQDLLSTLSKLLTIDSSVLIAAGSATHGLPIGALWSGVVTQSFQLIADNIAVLPGSVLAPHSRILSTVLSSALSRSHSSFGSDASTSIAAPTGRAECSLAVYTALEHVVVRLGSGALDSFLRPVMQWIMADAAHHGTETVKSPADVRVQVAALRLLEMMFSVAGAALSLDTRKQLEGFLATQIPVLTSPNTDGTLEVEHRLALLAAVESAVIAPLPGDTASPLLSLALHALSSAVNSRAIALASAARRSMCRLSPLLHPLGRPTPTSVAVTDWSDEWMTRPVVKRARTDIGPPGAGMVGMKAAGSNGGTLIAPVVPAAGLSAPRTTPATGTMASRATYPVLPTPAGTPVPAPLASPAHTIAQSTLKTKASFTSDVDMQDVGGLSSGVASSTAHAVPGASSTASGTTTTTTTTTGGASTGSIVPPVTQYPQTQGGSSNQTMADVEEDDDDDELVDLVDEGPDE